MLHDQTPHQIPEGQPDLGLHDPLAESFPATREGRLLFWLALSFSVFQIATAAHIVDFASQVVRAIHVGFLMLLTFPLVALARKAGPAVKTMAWIAAGLGVVVAFYQWYEYTELLLRAGDPLERDIVLGVITNVFYEDMGFSLQEIASYTKIFGIIMTIVGGFIGGVITTRFGVMRILLVGAIMVVLTNLLFVVLAVKGHDTFWLGVVIAADNMSAGIATAAFIAYLSSLTNISFTAIQYAIFSSLMTLLPKTIGGYSGGMVDQLGYQGFFIVATLLGLPAILLVLYLMQRSKTDNSMAISRSDSQR